MDSYYDLGHRGIYKKKLENKRYSYFSAKKTVNNEVNYIFNAFYKDQVAALYREVIRGH